jgi:ParB family chromosome partitioning protein
MIPIERITVLNPRERNKRVFGDIVTNIAHLGLKRPITVTRRGEGEGSEHYDLVCGQGRLEAYRALGQVEIPALVIDASERTAGHELGAEYRQAPAPAERAGAGDRQPSPAWL